MSFHVVDGEVRLIPDENWPHHDKEKEAAENAPSFEDLLEGIQVCYTDRAFDALAEGHDLTYVGSDLESTNRGTGCTQSILKALGVHIPSRFYADGNDRTLGGYTLSEALILILAYRAKKKNANIMHVISRNGLTEAIAVELWYRAPSES